MSDTSKLSVDSEAELERLDAEARLLDDTSDGIDWDELTATTQPDFEAGRFAFDQTTIRRMKPRWRQWTSSLTRFSRKPCVGLPRAHWMLGARRTPSLRRARRELTALRKN